jgi:hypothetical protein
MIEHLARLGYASKAVIYAIIGVLAILAATNQGGEVTDTSGALRVVLGQPFGRLLLVVLAAGLCGYGIWRLLDAFTDPDREGTGFGGLVERIGKAVRGMIYGALGLEAIRLFRGLGESSGDEAQIWTARIMDWPLGEFIIGITGAIVCLYGLSEILDSLREKRDAKIDMSVLPGGWRSPLAMISRFGVGARGAIIATLGFFLVRAAIEHDPTEAAGTRQSTLELAGAVEGRWLLALIAAGLLAYAVDQAVHSRCRRIRPVV